MNFWHERLDLIQAGLAEKPAVVKILRLPDIVSWEPGKVITEWEVDPEFFSIGGQVFGGYIGALADQVLGHTAMTVLDEGAIFRTIQANISYFEPMRAGKIRIEGTVVKRGRQTIHAKVDFYDTDDRLLCTAAGIQTIIPLNSRATS